MFGARAFGVSQRRRRPETTDKPVDSSLHNHRHHHHHHHNNNPINKQQLEEDWVRSNPEWVAELQLMLRTRTKAEIQALSSFGFQYLSQVYLPLKLQEGDWI